MEPSFDEENKPPNKKRHVGKAVHKVGEKKKGGPEKKEQNSQNELALDIGSPPTSKKQLDGESHLPPPSPG